MLKRLSLLAFVTLAACGSPQAGDSCTKEASMSCESNTVALLCESGKLRAIDCRGPGGCIQSTSQAQCDLTRARAGDNCPGSAEGQGQCDAGDPNRLLACKGGTWTAQACTACSTSGGNIYCQP